MVIAARQATRQGSGQLAQFHRLITQQVSRYWFKLMGKLNLIVPRINTFTCVCRHVAALASLRRIPPGDPMSELD